ncbi:CHAT domain-containing protein [Mycena epipterygia]|nr:CHAT domain-containing protein [Mycena epipterygia]
MHERILLLPHSHPSRAGCLNILGDICLGVYDMCGTLEPLNQAVCVYRDALRDDPVAPTRLGDLGMALRQRFERLGDLGDINESVSVGEAAVSLSQDGHFARPILLDRLGVALFRRFEQLGNPDDIKKAISMCEAAVELTPDDPAHLNNLGICLRTRFEQLGNLTDINESVSKFEAAVRLTPDGDQDKASRLNNLGSSLIRRFQRLGDIADINQSISKFEAAILLTPNGHPEEPSELHNLGTSLLNRFDRLGDLTDINQAVSKFEAAVELTPDGHPEKPSRLNNLGNSLHNRFERLGDLADINRSVSKLEAAVGLTPDGHPGKPLQLSNLGNSLLGRFERLGNLTDIDQSISRFEAALALTPDDHPHKPVGLNNLGNALLTRFERFGDVTDINQSVSVSEAAVALTPEGHPSKPWLLNNLGNSLHSRFERLHNLHDYQEMLAQYTSAACSPTGSAFVRFHASGMWATYARRIQHPSLLQAYTTAINLLPELAWLGLSIRDRHHHLLQAGQVVRDAASAAIAANQFATAVEWLEQGRSVIWGQILSLRTPVDVLRMSHPKLADELVSISTQLEVSGIRSSAAEITNTPELSLEASAQQSHDFADQRDRLLKRIRNLAGFERFLLSKPISELSFAATLGPVVLVNISNYGCDGLILMPCLGDEVIHIPLPDFTLNDVNSLAKSLGSLVRGGRTDRLYGGPEGQLPPEAEFSKILSQLWKQIVQPVLRGIAFMNPPTEDLGRIWWCPTGPLVFLPIHAAGLYDKDDVPGSKLSDFFISSYTPSLGALIEGFRATYESREQVKILTVAQPSALGQSYIPGTQKEINEIKKLADGILPVICLEQEKATVSSVEDGMKTSRWVHFACHGVQSISDPTESALLLAGSSRLTLSRIIQLRLPHADLAFLSACQTATGSRALQDESVHLTAGMLLAGYRGVIGTMWSIMDNDAPKVASDVYAHLFKIFPPDSTRAAEALHLAVQKLRTKSEQKSLFHWVPFIHVGV